MKRHIPNILTIVRLVLCLVMFAALALISVARNLEPRSLEEALVVEQTTALLARIALVSFVVAAVTDFFDGWLARKWQVVSTFGAIMDPIADKVLVCGAILGLVALRMPGVLIPGTLILFREFGVSAMREVLAPRGIKLPVTFLAKTKTAIQLIALTGFMVMLAWATSFQGSRELFGQLMLGVQVLFWVAAAITLWTGIEYGLAAGKAMKVPAPPPAPEPEPIVEAKKPATRRRTAKPE